MLSQPCFIGLHTFKNTGTAQISLDGLKKDKVWCVGNGVDRTIGGRRVNI